MKTRCSSLDLLLGCPSSQLPTENPYRSEVAKEEANLGTAKHEMFTGLGTSNPVDVDEVAHKYGVPASDLVKATAQASRVLEEIVSWFPGKPIIKAEQKVEGPVSIGRLDNVVRLPSEVDPQTMLQLVVTDFKTGHSEDEHPKQLAGYASGARAEYGMPSSGVITVVEAQIRFGQRIVRNYTADDLDAFEAEVRHAQEEGGPEKPHAGCRWCARQLVCGPRHEYVRAAAMAIVPFEKGTVIRREDLGAIYPQYQALMAAARLYSRMLDDELSIAPIPMPDGRLLRVVESESRIMDPALAFPVLHQEFEFTQEELREVMSASKSALTRIAPRASFRLTGRKKQGAALLRRIFASLDKAEAWLTKTSRQKKIVEPGDG